MNFEERLAWLEARYESLISRKNEPVDTGILSLRGITLLFFGDMTLTGTPIRI